MDDKGVTCGAIPAKRTILVGDAGRVAIRAAGHDRLGCHLVAMATPMTPATTRSGDLGGGGDIAISRVV